MQTHPTRRTANLILQPAGAETLVYDETVHRACCLNDLASVVWTASDGSRTAAAIA